MARKVVLLESLLFVHHLLFLIRSENRDYKGSGFDRGHMAAAGNHRLSQKDCHETFLLSNMAPQVQRTSLTLVLSLMVWQGPNKSLSPIRYYY